MKLTQWIGSAAALLLLLVALKAFLPYVILALIVYGGYHLYRRWHPKN
jgi:hypothetical protein